MKNRATSNAQCYVLIFKRAIIASAIATFLGACAGGTGEETGNGGTTGATPGLGAAVEVSEGDQTSIDVDSTTNTVEIPEVDSTTNTVEIPEVDSTTDTVEIPEVDSTTDTVEIPEVDSTTDAVEILEVDSTNSIPDNALGLIQSHPDLGLFATAIQSSGLVNYLADPAQRVTVFALSDKAFESLSTTQRDALFDDPTRLDTLVRATTITDRRLTEGAAGVENDIRSLSNNLLQFERDGDSTTIAGGSSDAVKVMDTLLDEEAAIHIIDDFINISSIFFPPDPGSIMEGLLEDGTRFSNLLIDTRWYRELGNSERGWTVFEPADRIEVGVSELGTHIVADDLKTLMEGTLTSVDEQSHVIKNVGDNMTIDDIDITEINALQVNNGQVHRIAFPLGGVYLDYDSDGILDVDDTDADGDGLDDFDGQDNFLDLNGDGLDDITLQTEVEANSGTVIEISAEIPCGSERGDDNSSVNNSWNDNCVVKSASNGGQFTDSLFAVGIQRILFCSGFGTGMDYTDFADGEFGPSSVVATIAFQQDESLTANGMVGRQTWERLKQRIELLEQGTPNQTPDTYGFKEGSCSGIPMFYHDTSMELGELSVIGGGWTLARNLPNEAQSVPFSYESPFGRL